MASLNSTFLKVNQGDLGSEAYFFSGGKGEEGKGWGGDKTKGRGPDRKLTSNGNEVMITSRLQRN